MAVPDFNFLFAPQPFRPELHGAMPQYTPPGGMGGGPAVAPTNVNMQPVAAPPAGVLAQAGSSARAQPQAAQAAPQAQERRYLMGGGLGDFLRANQGSLFNLSAGLLGGREGLQQALANMPAAMQGDRAAADRQKQNAALQQYLGSQQMAPEKKALLSAFPQLAAQQALAQPDLTSEMQNFQFAQENPAFLNFLDRGKAPRERKILKDAMGRQRYVDTGDLVFSDMAGQGGNMPLAMSPQAQTKGQEAIDKAYASDFVEWNTGGAADTAKNIQQLEEVAAALEGGKQNLTGWDIGLQPEMLRSVINEPAQAAKDTVEEVVQRNLRAVLGAQFTKSEGDRLIARAYNVNLSEAENAKRVRRLISAIQQAAQAKASAADYFQKNQTLYGWTGKAPTLSDIEAAAFGDAGGAAASSGDSNGDGVIDWKDL